MQESKGTLIEFFVGDHHHCDGEWAAFEAACDGVNSDNNGREKARAHWNSFARATLLHLHLEEEVAFPEFEARTGMTGGPTAMMRMEHERMRALISQIDEAVRLEEWDDALDHGDTLLLLTQQHNQKEEAILYPMLGESIGDDWPMIFRRVEEKMELFKESDSTGSDADAQ